MSRIHPLPTVASEWRPIESIVLIATALLLFWLAVAASGMIRVVPFVLGLIVTGIWLLGVTGKLGLSALGR